jgi:hypothetical protein
VPASRFATFVAQIEADEVIASTNTFDPIEREASYARLALAVGLRRRPRPAPWLDLML